MGGWRVVFERRYFLEKVYPKICFLFKVFSILFQYAGKEGGISLLASHLPPHTSKIPLILIANLSSNTVSPSFQMPPTSGPQPLLQCRAYHTWLITTISWLVRSLHLSLLSTAADWAYKNTSSVRAFPSRDVPHGPSVPTGSLNVSVLAAGPLLFGPDFLTISTPNFYSSRSLPLQLKWLAEGSPIPGVFSNP